MAGSMGFIGLGNMGSAMALNLLKGGNQLFVYNRTKDKAAKLIQEGAILVNSPTEMFDHAPIVFSMVANDQALREVSEELLVNAHSGCIHVSMSTVSPKLSLTLAETHKEKGVDYLTSPVFGRPDVAAQQSLWICLAGNDKAKKTVDPLLHLLAKKIYDFGENPAIPSAVKLTGNFLILTIIEALSEAFAFAEKSGVPLDHLHEFLTDSLFPSPVFQNYGRMIINQKFSPAGFKMELGLKDIDLLLRSAETLRVPLPIAGLLHDRLLSGLANHRGDLDWSAITLTEFEEAGLFNSNNSFIHK